MENHQNSSKPDLNSIVSSYHTNHIQNRPNCTIQTPADDSLEKSKLAQSQPSKDDNSVKDNQTVKVLIVDDDKVSVANKDATTIVNDESSKKQESEPAVAPTTSPVEDAKTGDPDQKVIKMNQEDVNAKASTFIDHDNDNKKVSPAHIQNNTNLKAKNTTTFVPDANGIVHTTVQAVNDLSAESIYGHDRKIYITAKLAKKMGLGAPNVKALDVDGVMIPIERLTKQELRRIKHEEAEETRKTRREKRLAKRNGNDDDLI